MQLEHRLCPRQNRDRISDWFAARIDDGPVITDKIGTREEKRIAACVIDSDRAIKRCACCERIERHWRKRHKVEIVSTTNLKFRGHNRIAPLIMHRDLE